MVALGGLISLCEKLAKLWEFILVVVGPFESQSPAEDLDR
jgi:hypothetical protein